ncbi:MAG: efflux RND transporter periplasmic adaptor subunit [Pseudomonadota bacterium]
MNNFGKLIFSALLLLVVAIAGYWFGTHATSAEKETMSTARAERQVLYYRNPMGLPDTSPVPKTDAMGMDYVPVYEGDEGISNGNQVVLNVEKVQKLGVKSEAATLRMLDKTVRAAGKIEINERRTYTIAPKFEGWVERLYVNASGQPVSKGQPLFEVYSPELISALREYALATQGEASLKAAGDEARSSMRQLAAASLARLRNWDIADDQIKQLASGEARKNLTYYAPVSGIVLEKKAVQGMRFMPGEMLYQIADLSSVWVIADVAEQDIGAVKAGSVAQVNMAAYPGKHFKGKVDFIYPTLNTETRTVQVRVELANPNGLLKPAMFANVELAASHGGKVLAVPVSAVIDSGTRQLVLVQLAQGRFEPRTVRLGSRSENHVEVLEGLAEGEQVVTSANFLIDAESNLKAALSGMTDQKSVGVSAGAAASTSSGQASAANADRQQAGSYQAVSVAHQAQGTLDAINEDGSASITHEPIASLGWPGMTMDFALANSSLAQGIQPGAAISFELVERKPGEYVITRLQAKSSAHSQHEGH